MSEKLMMLWLWLSAIWSILLWAKDYSNDIKKGKKYSKGVYVTAAIITWLVFGFIPYLILTG